MYGHVAVEIERPGKVWEWFAVRPAVKIGSRCWGVKIKHGLIHFMAAYVELLEAHLLIRSHVCPAVRAPFVAILLLLLLS
jgi:hypothetical protein